MIYSLDAEKKVFNDFKDVSFKKKRKKTTDENGENGVEMKKRNKKKPTSIMDELNLGVDATMDYSRDHGSRTRESSTLNADAMQAQEQKNRRHENYLRALNKAEEKSAMRNAQDEEEKNQRELQTNFFAEDDDVELQEALARARRLAAKKAQDEAMKQEQEANNMKDENGAESSGMSSAPDSIRAIAEQIRADKVKKESDITVKTEPGVTLDNAMSDANPNTSSSSSSDTTTIVFTRTTEFCRGLQFNKADEEEEARAKRMAEEQLAAQRQKEEAEAAAAKKDKHAKSKDDMEVDQDHAMDVEEEAKAESRWTTVDPTSGEQEQAEEDEEDEEEEEEDDSGLHDEPTTLSSVSAALELSRRKFLYLYLVCCVYPPVHDYLALFSTCCRMLTYQLLACL